jgi:hypothetical protein
MKERISSSFRDPDGFVYRQAGTLLRQVNHSYRENYETLVNSGLYDDLVGAGLLVPHQEHPADSAFTSEAFLVLEPLEVPVLSYPYEWCFGQLKDAALATLEIQKRALARGMTLKDASGFNIQFHEGRPILIDTLSFERQERAAPWIAYRQFCQHFLAPLALMSTVDIRLARLLPSFLDGLPLDLTSALLPRTSWGHMTLALHVHLHARSIRRHAQTARESVDRSRDVGRRGLEGLIDNLESAINRLDWKPAGTEWADYEEMHGYSTQARSEKERVVLEMLKDESPRVVWDLGSNTGRFSEVAASVAEVVVSMDGDPAAVEILYQRLKQRGPERILPLWVDLTNPSPALGWAHEERNSLLSRGPADTILALALIHHLAISNNLPLESIARLFRGLGRHLIIEFVPKTDSQTQRLLVSREDIFPDYSRAAFEHTFSRYFKTIRSNQLGATDRWIYSMVRIEQ